jgi:hypothetical protein
MTGIQPSRAAVLVAAVAAALALAAPAGAKTYTVSGTQTVVDEDAGTFTMQGGLIGDWAVTSFKQLGTSPLYRARGRERFAGCLDVRRDGSCAGDPSGTLTFRMLYRAMFGSQDSASLVWGACLHPIVRGTGAFAGARGVIAMADTPSAGGVRTAYIGNVTLGARSHRKARSAARAAAATGVRMGCVGTH